MKDGIAVAEHAKQAEIQQGWLDLARQQRRQLRELEERSRRLQDRVLDQNFGYRDFRSCLADWKVNQEVIDALTTALVHRPVGVAVAPIARRRRRHPARGDALVMARSSVSVDPQDMAERSFNEPKKAKY